MEEVREYQEVEEGLDQGTRLKLKAAYLFGVTLRKFLGELGKVVRVALIFLIFLLNYKYFLDSSVVVSGPVDRGVYFTLVLLKPCLFFVLSIIFYVVVIKSKWN